jgi:hypothetical protein
VKFLCLASSYVREFPFHDHFARLSECHVAVNPCFINRQHFASLSPLLLLFSRMQYFDLHSSTLCPVNQHPRFWLALPLLKTLDSIQYGDCASDRTTEKMCFDSRQTHCYIFSRTSRLTLGQIHPPIQWVLVITSYSENHTEPVNTLQGQMCISLMLKHLVHIIATGL